MPYRCSVKSCKNAYAETKHTRIEYYRFPKDPEIATQWVKACDKENINLNDARVCSVHFKEDCFVKKPEDSAESGDTNIFELLKFAVPTEKLTDDNDTSCKRKPTVLDDNCDFDKLEYKLNKWGVTIIDLRCNKNDNNTSQDKIQNCVSDSSSATNSSVNLTNANEDHCSTAECNENGINTSQGKIQNCVSDSSSSASNSSINLTNDNGNLCSTTEKQTVLDNHCCEFNELEHKLNKWDTTITNLRSNKNGTNTSQGKIPNSISESPSSASNSCVHLTSFCTNSSLRTEEQIVLDDYIDFNELERKLSELSITRIDLSCNKNDNNTSQDEIQNCVSDSSSATNSSVNLANTNEDHCCIAECNESSNNSSQDEIQKRMSDLLSTALDSSVDLTNAIEDHCSTPKKKSNCEISESQNKK